MGVRVLTEEAFEAGIVASMLATGWHAGDQESYAAELITSALRVVE